jgi:hypothetical protein
MRRLASALLLLALVGTAHADIIELTERERD